MNIAICDDDIEFCTTLKRQLTDCLQYNDIIDIYYSGEMFLAGCKNVIMMPFFWICIWVE
ncbi:unknown [Eubacterium sp. CAG:38]|nr:unknown [Eubacterium sp. CAG:38]